MEVGGWMMEEEDGGGAYMMCTILGRQERERERPLALSLSGERGRLRRRRIARCRGVPRGLEVNCDVFLHWCCCCCVSCRVHTRMSGHMRVQ